jgi:hypothetical protein
VVNNGDAGNLDGALKEADMKKYLIILLTLLASISWAQEQRHSNTFRQRNGDDTVARTSTEEGRWHGTM